MTPADVQRRAFALEGQLSGLDIKAGLIVGLTPRRLAMACYIDKHAPDALKTAWVQGDVSTLEAFTQLLQKAEGGAA